VAEQNKTLVVGYYFKSNIGDQSYCITFPKLFPNNSFIFTDNPKNIKEDYNSVILGGGSVIYEAYLSKLKDINKNKYAVSVSVINDSDINGLRDFKQIFVRDFKSLEKLKENGIESKYIPDLAFCLEPDKVAGANLIKQLFKQENKELKDTIITVVINAHLLFDSGERLAKHEAQFQRFSYEIMSSLDELDASIIFLPFSTSMPYDDRVSSGWLSSKTKGYRKNLVIYNPLSVMEALNLISASNLTISSRLHSSIFSCISKVPFIDLTHHDKNLAFLDTMNLEELSIPYWDFNKFEFGRLVKAILEQRDRYQAILKTITENQREILYKETKNVCFI
jgi:polysaccharide pyruvyl transferase WcaK-like protein